MTNEPDAGRMLVIDTITWKPHIETSIEIALRHKELGGEVVYCNMRAGLPLCEDSLPVHVIADLPATRIRRGSELLRREGVLLQTAEYTREERSAAFVWARKTLSACASRDDISAISYDDFFDMGWGVLSSAISMTRSANISPSVHRRLLTRLLASSWLLYHKTQEMIETCKPDTVVLFNGRFATTRAVLRASEKLEVRWLTHERGCDLNHFLVTDCFANEPECFQRLLDQHCKLHGLEAGHDFFQQRRGRTERAWHSFVKHQEQGRLPEAVAAGGDWVTFYTSSEDELAAIGDSVIDPLYPLQMDAIRCLADAVQQIPGLRLCVRVHPFVAQKSAKDRRLWDELQIADAVVVGPGEKVDTYALLDRSKVVASFGSTVGVEATYWGKPSLLFGRSLYDSLGACERAGDLEHVANFLRNPRVCPQENAMRYGSFSQSFGDPYRYYQAEGLHRGSILGVFLDDTPLITASKKVAELGKRARDSFLALAR